MATIIHNGRTIDEETGEVLDEQGVVTADRFEITDIETLKWFIRKLKRKDTIIDALRGELAEVTATISTEIARAEAERENFHARFVDGARTVVTQALEGQSSKTFKTPFGNARFRTVPGGAIKIIDDAAALAYAKINHPNAVKTTVTEKVLVSELKADAAHLPGTIFEVSQSVEKFEIVTTTKETK